MNTAAFTILLPAIALTLAGCATSPGHGFLNTNTPEAAGSAPQNYRQAIDEWLRANLRDPYSVQDLTVSTPTLAACAVGIYGVFNGWRVVVSYNAKNLYGAYVGVKTYYYWFHGERLKGVNQTSGLCPEAAGWLS